MGALVSDDVELGQMTRHTEVPGLGVLTVRPSGVEGSDERDAAAELFTTVIERLLATHDRVVVASPPPIDGVHAAMMLVVPSRGGRCDVIRDVVSPLRLVGYLPDAGIADAPDLLVATLVSGAVERCIPGAETMALTGGGVSTSALEAEAGDVVPRLYYLSAETIGSLRVFARTLSDRLGRHVKLSEIVSVAIRTSPILDEAERLGDRGVGQARTFYLRPTTLNHLTQLALLASRALGHHVRLSDVVDLSIRLHCAQPLERQTELLQANVRKRGNRA